MKITRRQLRQIIKEETEEYAQSMPPVDPNNPAHIRDIVQDLVRKTHLAHLEGLGTGHQGGYQLTNQGAALSRKQTNHLSGRLEAYVFSEFGKVLERLVKETLAEVGPDEKMYGEQ